MSKKSNIGDEIIRTSPLGLWVASVLFVGLGGFLIVSAVIAIVGWTEDGPVFTGMKVFLLLLGFGGGLGLLKIGFYCFKYLKMKRSFLKSLDQPSATKEECAEQGVGD